MGSLVLVSAPGSCPPLIHLKEWESWWVVFNQRVEGARLFCFRSPPCILTCLDVTLDLAPAPLNIRERGKETPFWTDLSFNRLPAPSLSGSLKATAKAVNVPGVVGAELKGKAWLKPCWGKALEAAVGSLYHLGMLQIVPWRGECVYLLGRLGRQTQRSSALLCLDPWQPKGQLQVPLGASCLNSVHFPSGAPASTLRLETFPVCMGLWG